MKQNISFLHLTDLHISDPGQEDPGLRSDTIKTLKTVRRMIDQISPKPSFIVASGDLTNRGDATSYRILRDLMTGIDIPILYALGNHDTRPGFYEGMLDRKGEHSEPYDHEAEIDGVHVITLDSSVPGRIGGALEARQFDFLQRALESKRELPKLLVIHHAPALDDDPDWEWESLRFSDSARFADMIRGRNVVGILSGHIHRDRVSNWNGVPLVVGNGLHGAFDPLFSGDGLRMVTGESFSLCVLRESGLTVNFVPLPSERREIKIFQLTQIKAKA